MADLADLTDLADLPEMTDLTDLADLADLAGLLSSKTGHHSVGSAAFTAKMARPKVHSAWEKSGEETADLAISPFPGVCARPIF